jgi:hypothetical protein
MGSSFIRRHTAGSRHIKQDILHSEASLIHAGLPPLLFTVLASCSDGTWLGWNLPPSTSPQSAAVAQMRWKSHHTSCLKMNLASLDRDALSSLVEATVASISIQRDQAVPSGWLQVDHDPRSNTASRRKNQGRHTEFERELDAALR